MASAQTSTVPPPPSDNYVFPDHRLKRSMNDPEKTPLLLVACGSFSPGMSAMVGCIIAALWLNCCQ